LYPTDFAHEMKLVEADVYACADEDGCSNDEELLKEEEYDAIWIFLGGKRAGDVSNNFHYATKTQG